MIMTKLKMKKKNVLFHHRQEQRHHHFLPYFFNQENVKLLRERMKNLHTRIQARIKEFEVFHHRYKS